MTRIWEALDRLQDGKRWRRSESSTESRCLLGSLTEDGTIQYWDYKNPDVVAIADVIREQFPDRLNGFEIRPNHDNYHTRTVWVFNDNPRTTFEDVRVVMEKAAIARQEVM